MSGLKLVSGYYIGESNSTHAVAGRAIPKCFLLIYNLQQPTTSPISTATTDTMDTLQAPFASYAGIGSRGAGTVILDTVQPS